MATLLITVKSDDRQMLADALDLAVAAFKNGGASGQKEVDEYSYKFSLSGAFVQFHYDDLQPGDLFTLGTNDTIYAKKGDGEYIVVRPGKLGGSKVGDKMVGREEHVYPVTRLPPR